MSQNIEKSRWVVYGLELCLVPIGLVFLIISLLGFGMDIVPYGSQISSAMCALIFGVALILIEQLFKYRFPIMLHIIYIIYVFASNIIGSNLGLFRLAIGDFYWYDKVMHAILGYVLCIISIYFGIKNNIWNRSFWGNILIILAISMAFASIWEIFEFTCDRIIPGQDMQRGPMLLDTMCDMIAHFFTTVIFLIQYSISYFTKYKLGMSFIVKNLMTGGSVRVKNNKKTTNNDIAGDTIDEINIDIDNN